MTSPGTPTGPTPPPRSRPATIAWLLRLNEQVAGWVASMSWWRLVLLFIVILAAAAAVSDKLRLHHDRERVAAPPGKGVEVRIGGPEGIRIRKKGNEPAVDKASGEAAGAASAPGAAAPPTEGAASAAAPADVRRPKIDIVADAEDVRWVSKTVFTFRGLLGDIGSTILIVLFAYLIAAKVVVRKVALADEKVRTAVDAAEREAMERQLTQARLQVLQAQVEPHFLFNTLSAVDYLIETDPPRASQMQKQLITYLRGALPQMREESSTLGRELRLIRSYLELIKMRIEERLEVEISVPELLESAQFPPMMLQSLVENAIKHGIEPKPEGGKVTVSARVQGGQLWVEVRDTGVGIANLMDMDMDKLQAPTSGTGIGLQNIRERLVMLYRGKGRLVLMSDPRSGTAVRIGIPYEVRSQPDTTEEPEGQPA